MSDEPQLPTPTDSTTQMIRTFSNPVCKQTYNSLPKIYGKKKKTLRLAKSPSQNNKSPQEISNLHNKHYYSANEDYPTSTTAKRAVDRERSLKLSQPKVANQCSKKNCSCKDHLEKKKSKSTFSRRILLPQIRKFQLQDLESQHKVLMNGLHSSKVSNSSGLNKIIEQNQKMRATSSNNFQQHSHKTSKSFHRNNLAEEEEDDKNTNLRKRRVQSLADQKNKHRFKPTFNSKFDIEEESEEEQNTDELKNLRQARKVNLLTGRYKTDANDQESPKSIPSISLSSFVFKGVKRSNTKFHELNQTQKSFEKKLSRQASQLSNGLFRIPEEPEFSSYIKNHRVLNEEFNIKKIAKQSNFRIIRSVGEVYFGEVDEEQRKHGSGLNVTDKQIFEGSYNRNIKVQGCERNIDGVYEGGFLNGLRSGFGTFKWNNGEIFEGNWENGMKNGTGTWKSPKGDSYVGEWKQNRQEGSGVFKHRLSTYTGQYKNFLKCGHGMEKFSNGDFYQGSYLDGKPHGKGRYQWHEGGHYEGEFIKGMREGRGKWVDANGTIYQVQALLNQILNMDSGNSGTALDNATKESSMRGAGQEGACTKRVGMLLRYENETDQPLSILILSQFYFMKSLIYGQYCTNQQFRISLASSSNPYYSMSLERFSRMNIFIYGSAVMCYNII